MKICINHMDLKQIAESGQTFRWQPTDGGYMIPAFGRCLYVTQNGNEFTFSCDEAEWDEIWASYFDMDTDYDHIEELIMKYGDAHLKEAYSLGSGIRILRQELWEMLITFMISQNNNIPRITGSVDKICNRYGRVIEDGTHAFPSPEDVTPGAFDDKTLGLGYRNEYLELMYSYAKEHMADIEALKNCDYDTCIRELLKFKGIGIKVANCVALFGLHHTESFPIDTHVKQLLEKYYPDGLNLADFEGYAGVIQQYLFYYELKNKK